MLYRCPGGERKAVKQECREFHFSQKTKILLEFLSHLAEDVSGDPQTIDALARKIGYGKSYIHKLLKPLRDSGIVMPIRGSTGGYVLNAEPKNVTLLHLLASTGDAGVLYNCDGGGSGECAARGEGYACSLHGFWHTLTDFLHNTFGSITLQDIIDGDVKLPSVMPAFDMTGGENAATKERPAKPSATGRLPNQSSDD